MPRRSAAPPSLAAALASADRLVARRGGRKAVARLARSPHGRTPERATAFAAAAVGAGRDAAALAALLRAHRLARRDPRPLINAAVVLTNLGRPREALALLEAAQRLPQTDRAPLAISTRSLIAVNRGWALLNLGQWAAAEKQLARAAKQAPLLSEARRNLAHAQTCQGKFAAAAKAVQDGARRQEPTESRTVRTVDEAGQPSDEQLAPELWLDLSRGVEPTLPAYRWPRSEVGGKAMYDALRTLYTSVQQRGIALAREQGEATRRSAAESAGLSPLTRARILQLWRIQGNVDRHPDLLPLYLDYTAKQSAIGRIQTRYGSGQGGMTCGEASFQEWRQALIAYDDATRAWVRGSYRRMTAIAANAAGPALHETLMLRARHSALVHLSGVLQQGSYLAEKSDKCISDEVAQASPGEDTTQTPDAPGCPPGLTGKAFKGRVSDLFTVSVECEKIGVEVDSGGLIGAFGSITHNGPRGETTIFIGPRVKLRTPGPLGPGATYRDGIYVTFGADGNVSDFGGRVEGSVSFGAGDASGSLKLDSMDFSLVGVSPLSGFLGTTP